MEKRKNKKNNYSNKKTNKPPVVSGTAAAADGTNAVLPENTSACKPDGPGDIAAAAPAAGEGTDTHVAVSEAIPSDVIKETAATAESSVSAGSVATVADRDENEAISDIIPSASNGKASEQHNMSADRTASTAPDNKPAEKAVGVSDAEAEGTRNAEVDDATAVAGASSADEKASAGGDTAAVDKAIADAETTADGDTAVVTETEADEKATAGGDSAAVNAAEADEKALAGGDTAVVTATEADEKASAGGDTAVVAATKADEKATAGGDTAVVTETEADEKASASGDTAVVAATEAYEKASAGGETSTSDKVSRSDEAGTADKATETTGVTADDEVLAAGTAAKTDGLSAADTTTDTVGSAGSSSAGITANASGTTSDGNVKKDAGYSAADKAMTTGNSTASGVSKTAYGSDSDFTEPKGNKPKGAGKNKKKRSRLSLAILIAILILISAVGGVYGSLAHYYKDHFLPGSTIDEVDVSGMDAEEAKAAIQDSITLYFLKVNGRQLSENITSKGLGMTFANPEEVNNLLENQDRWSWPLYYNKITKADLSVQWSVDEAALRERVSQMDFFKEENIVPPTDAYITDGTNNTKTIAPETEGRQPDLDKVYELIKNALEHEEENVDIDEGGCYVKPAVYRDDAKLNERLDKWNSYLRSVGLTYDYSDRKEVLDYATLCGLIIDDGENVYLNEDAIADLVQEWKQKYDTFGRSRKFTTHSGKVITVTGGDYGWVIKKADTVAEIISLINEGDNSTHTPPYLYKALSRDTNDIGGTYVEISISQQHMWLYVDNEVVVSTPVVTGNPNRGNSTTPGCYAIDAKKSPAVLKGQGYESHVEYWMPFNGNQGIHDADNWRSSYGGDIYLSNGSHGCVNTPRNKVRTIYEKVKIGTPVIVY